MDLAEKGDYKGIDIIGSDLKKGGTHKNEVDKEDGLYFSYPDDITTYYLGKAADSDGKCCVMFNLHNPSLLFIWNLNPAVKFYSPLPYVYSHYYFNQTIEI